MPDFAWKARTMSGQDVSGVITADTRRDVLAMLSQRALSPLSVTQAKAPVLSLKLQRGVKPDVLAATLTQLSDLLTNGVPLLQALDLLSRQVTHDHLKEVLLDIRTKVLDRLSE